MKHTFRFLFFILLLCLLPHSSQAESVQEKGATEKASYSIAKEALQNSTRVNVLFKDTIDYSLLKKYHADIIYDYHSIEAVTIEIDPNQMDQLSKEPQIKSIEKDQLVQLQSQTTSWGYSQLNLENSVPSTLTGKNIRIAIIDTGVDTSHPDLKIAGGKCVLEQVLNGGWCSKSYEDDNGHGTHVAGIIGAQNNDIGVVGVAPEASIYAIKALDQEGYGTTSSILAGIDWAIQNNMDIINMSLNSEYYEPAMESIIKKAYNKGILIVAAAGNEEHVTGKEENVLYPAKFSQAIAVSALGRSMDLIHTSSVGKEMELTAPGGSIYSTVPLAYDIDGKRDGYMSMSGTSMATPFVSAVAALYMEKFPDLTNVQIRKLLQSNAKDLGVKGRDAKFGYGLVQMDTSPEVVTNFTARANEKGIVKIEINKLPDNATGYNLYRFNNKIISNGKSTSLEDYASKGSLEYKLIPVVDGNEMILQTKIVKIDVASPNIKDMNNSYWFSRNLMYLYQENILSGYDTGEVKPLQNINRLEAVVLLVRALGLDLDDQKSYFKDVPAKKFGANYVAAAVNNGILSGFADGTFRPSQTVTRVEMSIMISKAFQLQQGTLNVTSFKDVNKKIAGYDAIQKVVSNGIAQGYDEKTFKPYEKMNRATYAVFLSRAYNSSLKVQ